MGWRVRSKTKCGLGSGLQIVECGLGLATLTFLGSSMLIFFLVIKPNSFPGLIGSRSLVGLEFQKGLKKIEKVKMMKISTHLHEVGFFQETHKQIRQKSQYNG